MRVEIREWLKPPPAKLTKLGAYKVRRKDENNLRRRGVSLLRYTYEIVLCYLKDSLRILGSPPPLAPCRKNIVLNEMVIVFIK